MNYINNRLFNNGATPVLTGSFMQGERHESVSDKFKPTSAAMVAQVMADHGLELKALKSGNARLDTYADFQRTISTFINPNTEIVSGVKPTIIFKNNHLGRGQSEVIFGLYRLVCSNGLMVCVPGLDITRKIRHNGDTYINLDNAVREVLQMSAQVTEIVQKMQLTTLDATGAQRLIDAALKLLVPVNAVNVRHTLSRIQRDADKSPDLFTIFNVIQENAMQGRIAYDIVTTDENQVNNVRHMTVRKIKLNSEKDLNFNQEFFSAAAQLIAA